MNTLQFKQNPSEGLFEFTEIFDELKETRINAKRSLGELGLSLRMPISLLIGAYKLKTQSHKLTKFSNKIISEFKGLDERSQMKLEVKIVQSAIELEKKILPTLKKLESSNFLFKNLFLKQSGKILSIIHNTTRQLTEIVYPEQRSPSNDPALFNKLVESYKGVDLSDWKENSYSEYDKPFNKHAHV